MAFIVISIVATVAWATLTGHELSVTGESVLLTPFNEAWRASLLANFAGAGILLAIPVAWFVVRDESQTLARLYLGTSGAVAAGALAWGAELPAFDSFHFFFAAIDVIVTPVAAAAAWTLVARLRAAGKDTRGRRRPYCALFKSKRASQQRWSDCKVSVLWLSLQFRRMYSLLYRTFRTVRASHMPAVRMRSTGFGSRAWRASTRIRVTRVIPMCHELDLASRLVGGNPTVGDREPSFPVGAAGIPLPR